MIPHHPTHPNAFLPYLGEERGEYSTCTPDDLPCVVITSRRFDEVIPDRGACFWECTSTLLGAVVFDDDGIAHVYDATQALNEFGPVWVAAVERLDAEAVE